MNVQPNRARTGSRFVSRLTRDTVAVVLAGGRGTRLGPLTDWRAKPAVPFAGKFRIIDFALSNCVNSQIRRILVLTQYKAHSLIKHLLNGWTYMRVEHGEFIDIVPAQQWVSEQSWYRGTADAVYQTLDIVESYGPGYVLILAGDHVYNMDYGEMLAAHVEAGADVTIGCTPVPLADACNFGVMQVDATGRIVRFDEKPACPEPIPGQPETALASMGIYVFSMRYLRKKLNEDAADGTSAHDFGMNIVPNILARGDTVHAYQFNGPAGGPDYWRDVGTLDAYYRANMELLSEHPPLDIYDGTWPVMTYQPQLPPAEFVGCGSHCHVENSMVSGGCMIKRSSLDTTVLFSNVKIHEDCQLQGVLALPGCEIGHGSRLTNAILDNRCTIEPGTVIGDDPEADRRRFHVTEGGVVVVNRKMLGLGTCYRPGLMPGPNEYGYERD